MACQYLRSSCCLTPLRTEIRCGAAGLSTHEHDDTVKQAKTLQSLFAVALALVLNRQHRCIEDHFAVHQINSMLRNVLSALRLVPSDHYLIVYIKMAIIPYLTYWSRHGLMPPLHRREVLSIGV